MKTYKLSILSRDASAYASLVQNKLPESIVLTQTATSVAAIDPFEVNILLADPDLAVALLPQCHHLAWYQSTWAGNAPLMHLSKRDYVLTGVKEVFGPAMREYVFAYLLYFSRNIKGFETQQACTHNRWRKPAIDPLNGKTLAILGAGSIARALLPVATALGLAVVGLSRSGQQQSGYRRIYSVEERLAFAAQADYLVNLLPHTPATEHFIDRAFLEAMPVSSVLINAGRGQAIDDEALLSELARGHLRAAVLDVFRQEPLPDNHPFWIHPRIHITQHTAAISEPADIANIFLENVVRFTHQRPLLYTLDFEQGY